MQGPGAPRLAAGSAEPSLAGSCGQGWVCREQEDQSLVPYTAQPQVSDGSFSLPQPFSPFSREPERLLQSVLGVCVLPGLRLAWKQGGGTWTAAPHAVLSYPWTPLLPQRFLFQLHNQKVNGRTRTFFFIVLVSIFARRDCLALCAEQCKPNECCSGLQRRLAGSISG